MVRAFILKHGNYKRGFVVFRYVKKIIPTKKATINVCKHCSLLRIVFCILFQTVKKKQRSGKMANSHVEYCRAEHRVEFSENNCDGEAVIYQQKKKNEKSKLEKFLVVCVVVLVFLCAVFAGLYFYERQHRYLKKKGPTDENEKCNQYPDAKLYCSSNEALTPVGFGKNMTNFCSHILLK